MAREAICQHKPRVRSCQGAAGHRQYQQDRELHRSLLIFRRQGAAFGKLFHVAEHFLEEQTVCFHLLLPGSIVWQRGAIPHQSVVESCAPDPSGRASSVP